MGHWQTIHLFDYKKFRKNGIHNLMKNKEEFKTNCQRFLELTPYIEDGKSLSIKEKLEKLDSLYIKFNGILEEFDTDLSIKKLKGNEDESKRKDYITSIYDYNFARFIIFLIFSNYADYFPFTVGGKNGIQNKFEPNKSLAFELLIKLDTGLGQNYFSIEHHGIVGWLTEEEITLLNMDFDNLSSKKDSYIDGFLNLIKIANKENFGIILGVDMPDDRIYSDLQSEIVDYTKYYEYEIEGLHFEKQ